MPAHTVTASVPPPPAPRTRPRPRPVPPPGSLPQTDQRPTAAGAEFRAEMAALWRAIVENAPARGGIAFFPEAAYVQLKTVPDARSDFRQRLRGAFALDVAAAHALLVGRPGRADLIDVRVPAGYAHWVPPGVCANRVGYYEVPNARVVYRQAGVVRSFGIASMISWRGVWYVIHLGAVLRRGFGGELDAPALGPGVSTPSSTC